MDLVLTNIYIFILATVLAILEIQIEGEHGWAKNLPTWRPRENLWFVKIYSKVMGGREVTGYHMTMFSLVLLIFHLPYVFGLPFTIDRELRTLSFYFIFIGLWDFLWFVLNPHYPLSKFKKEHIWWHRKWFLFAPLDYYLLLFLSFVVVIPTNDIYWWAFNVSLFSIQTLFVILFTLHILKIDKWKIS